MTIEELLSSLEHLTRIEYLYIAGAFIALTCVLVLLVRRQPKNVVAYSTESGRVMVSRHAIVELVQTSCEQLQDVSKPQVKIKVKGQTAHFEIRIKLLSGGKLRKIEETLQTHLRKALTDNLGIESLGQINIVATGFKSGRIESSLPSKSAQAPIIQSENPLVEEIEDEPESFDAADTKDSERS